jgi:hypothetical protein
VEIGVAVAMLVFSLIVIAGSLQAGIEWASDGPRAGFFPFYCAIFVLVASLVNLFQAINLRSAALFAEWGQIGQVLSVVVPSVIYVTILPWTGMYVASVLLIAVFMKWIGKYNWPMVIGVSIPVMIFVGHDRVPAGNEIVLEPAPGNSRGDDDDIPARCCRRGFPLPVDHADVERLPKDGLGDRPDTQGFSGPGTGDDSESDPACSPLPELVTVLTLQHRLEMQSHGQLDGLTGGPGRRDHDHPAVRVNGSAVGLRIEGELVVPRRDHEAALARRPRRSSGRVYISSAPSGFRGHSSRGRSQSRSTPLPSGSAR